MKNLRYVVVDVFTDRALTGNPLAVFTDGRGLSDARMQDLAREMNLSETVFVFPPASGGDAKLRIFTPRRELPFAGHPVLGAAFVLGGPLQSDLVRLETGAGVIPVRLERAAATLVFGWMTQPVPTFRPFDNSQELLSALGVEGAPRLPVVEADNGVKSLLVVLDSPDVVTGLQPNHSKLERLAGASVSVSAPLDVTPPSGATTAFKTRVFAPHAGVFEDPATGSAAGPLGAHLARHGLAPFGETLVLFQGDELGRPSELSVLVTGNLDALESVQVGGAAVIVARGEMRVP